MLFSNFVANLIANFVDSVGFVFIVVLRFVGTNTGDIL
jgi:hypothetical protein